MTAPDTPRHPTGQAPAVARLVEDANAAIGSGQPGRAVELLDRALALAPADGEIHRTMGVAALMSGQGTKAVEHLRRAHAAAPDDATIHMTLGSALFETGAVEEGLAHLERTCELAPEAAAAWYNYGRALQVAHRMEPARVALERAVALEPDSIQARNTLATTLISLGDTDAATAALRESLRRQPGHAGTWYVLGNLKTERFSRDDAALLTRLFQQPGTSDEARVMLGYALGMALEDQGEYARAFDAIQETNALKRRYVDWDRDRERHRVDAIAQAFAQAPPAPADPALGREVIFVVCLPRSGSTLTEQILASHPEVEGGDEMPALGQVLDEESLRRKQPFPDWVPAASSADWQRMGQAYLARTRHLRGQRPRFTDKSVDNWAYVGAALAMLPGARVVNSRRDPLETCFACYRQLFAAGCAFSYDLDDMVGYYAGYERLSALWRQRFPQRYFEHVYESLQRDAEGQIRRLLEFCHLPFDPACLEWHRTRRTVRTISSTQVREPLRKDTARGARYGARLDPLRERLQAALNPLRLPDLPRNAGA